MLRRVLNSYADVRHYIRVVPSDKHLQFLMVVRVCLERNIWDLSWDSNPRPSDCYPVCVCVGVCGGEGGISLGCC